MVIAVNSIAAFGVKLERVLAFGYQDVHATLDSILYTNFNVATAAGDLRFGFRVRHRAPNLEIDGLSGLHDADGASLWEVRTSYVIGEVARLGPAAYLVAPRPCVERLWQPHNRAIYVYVNIVVNAESILDVHFQTVADVDAGRGSNRIYGSAFALNSATRNKLNRPATEHDIVRIEGKGEDEQPRLRRKCW